MTGIIATDQQQLTQGTIVELFEIDATRYGNGILRFTPTSNAGASLFFNGYEYVAAPVKADGFEWKSGGTLPRPSLAIASGDPAFLSLVMGTDDLTGCPVTRTRTYRKYLDDGSDPNPTSTFPVDHYVINQKTEQSRYSFVFELTPEMDQEGRLVPALQVLRDTCRHTFRKWDGANWDYTGVTCPYTGSGLYDIYGNTTTDESQAQCGKKLSDCVLHFGENAVLPMRAFPGVARF